MPLAVRDTPIPGGMSLARPQLPWPHSLCCVASLAVVRTASWGPCSIGSIPNRFGRIPMRQPSHRRRGYGPARSCPLDRFLLPEWPLRSPHPRSGAVQRSPLSPDQPWGRQTYQPDFARERTATSFWAVSRRPRLTPQPDTYSRRGSHGRQHCEHGFRT
jgi:hypothetical protein